MPVDGLIVDVFAENSVKVERMPLCVLFKVHFDFWFVHDQLRSVHVNLNDIEFSSICLLQGSGASCQASKSAQVHTAALP